MAMLAGAGVTVLASPAAPAAATTTCRTSACVVNLEVQRGGLSLGMTFNTTVPTTDQLYVYQSGVVAGQTSSSTPRTTHQLSIPSGLLANTVYTWHLITTDGSRNSVEKTGTMTTLHRQVTVQFSTDTVFNDSDNNGSGEFRTWVKAGTKSSLSLLTPTDINSGDTVLIATVLSVTDVGETTKVTTEMYDDDTFIVSQFPSNPDWTSGHSWIADWSTANGVLNTKNATNGILPFVISVNSSVGFAVHGFYSVSFVS